MTTQYRFVTRSSLNTECWDLSAEFRVLSSISALSTIPLRHASIHPYKIGVIGGSGLYQIDGLTDFKETKVETPFGQPSDLIITGTLQGVPIAFLPRHGRGHRISPSELPVRANIFALKLLGVERIISISAVGSLKEDIRPLDLVIPDQVIDRTRGRASTFFGRGLVAHIGFAEPFCPHLSHILYQTAKKLSIRAHNGGTCVVMEGPAFSTKAESHLYRSWGASIVGMTAARSIAPGRCALPH